MDGHDAFGREKGENPLEEMGWSEPAAAAAEPATTPAEPEIDVAAGAPAPTPPPSTVPSSPMRVPVLVEPTRGPRVVRWLVLLVVLAIVAGAASLIVAIGDTVDGIKLPTIAGDGSGGRDGGDLPAKAPEGLGKGSLVLRGNLSPALRELRRAVGGGRLRFVRVDPKSVQLQAVRGDRLVFARKPWDGDASVVSSSPGGTSAATFSWARVNASAPRRLATAIGPNRFDYAVLIDAAGLRWSAFSKSGRNLQSGPDGRT